jgi:predicted hydrolase (HD superfamily)
MNPKDALKKHPGFQKVQASIAKKEGVSSEAAGAILASASRKASPKAKRVNPNLNKVKG